MTRLNVDGRKSGPTDKPQPGKKPNPDRATKSDVKLDWAGKPLVCYGGPAAAPDPSKMGRKGPSPWDTTPKPKGPRKAQ